MSPIRKSLFPFSSHNKPKAEKTQLFHKVVSEKDGYTSRIHLRINPDGSGVLWVNANQTFHLNQSATMFAQYLFEGKSEEQIRMEIKKSFPKNYAQVLKDFEEFSPPLKALINGNGFVCDLCESGIASEMPFKTVPSAPFRMDLAITYACNNNCTHCYNEKDRIVKSLPINGWKRILKKIADLGIPHVVFTGGEPTLIPDLIELIKFAEISGLITGINSNGRRMSDLDFTAQLIDTGIDHIQITLESHREDIHDQMVGEQGAWQETVAGIRNAVKSRAFVMTNTTLLRSNATPENAIALVDFLHSLSVKTVGINALIYSGRGRDVDSGLHEAELPALLAVASDACQRNGQRLIWYTPTQYCQFDPLENGYGLKGCTAARYAMCIEPDGSVLPCQSWYQPVGNILTDSWESIWNHPLCQSIRDRKLMPEGCDRCEKALTCGGGCPLAAPYLPQVKPINTIPPCF